MKTNPNINPDVFFEVKRYLSKIEEDNNIVILHAIESGSRAWGFPSPDSDYDVRFIYSHPTDWYLQLVEERDVIEIPISDELDIAGWDVRKALNLANKGNAVVQEWMISPIVYKQTSDNRRLNKLLTKAFNPTVAYYHYRSMAKKAYLELQQSEVKKLKRFFYFARATLSAQWILTKGTMPSILFADLVAELVPDKLLAEQISNLVKQKAKESEKSVLLVPQEVLQVFTAIFKTLDEGITVNSGVRTAISNNDFRSFLAGD